ncbi:MAG TPA: nucleoside-diphosphate sugar epimerase/dehydratase [Anaerolineaceae bacterium]|nr:nucleoside-diphosphate sugar epimerase/dehydratase [Anaerolineaceae bacterium]
MKTSMNVRNRYLFLGDLILIIVSVMISYLLKFELTYDFYTIYLPSAVWMSGVALVVKPLVYYSFGLYRRVWSYASIQELKLILVAVSLASVPVALIMIALFSLRLFPGFPRMALVIDFLLSLLAVGGLRFAVRILAENQRTGSLKKSHGARTVLVAGAGDAGALMVREMQRNPQLDIIPVGFVDDDSTKQGQQIYGVPVVGKLSDLADILDQSHVSEVVIAIPSAPGRVVRTVADICRLKGIPFRTMPGIYELLGGKVSVSRLREVDIADLLRREPVHVRDSMVGGVVGGRVVLVTGSGGSIGRELCRQIARWGPSEILLLGHGENSIFETMLELKEDFPSLLIRPLIADVRDLPRLQALFKRHRPQVVFHAAAHKHVPLMETNVEEAITNNVLGASNIVSVALEYGVERLVMISTDKAIHPSSVMGATKRMAEMIVLDAAARSGLPYCVVRFGNVLGSRGSVVPLFKRQISHGGPVTITHPDMKRFFMTIPEAVYLVLQAASMGEHGETFVLDMGEQVRIVDLAEDLIRLSGLEPGKDIEIVFTGVRPGEKLSEELWDEGDQLKSTAHPEVLRLEGEPQLTGAELKNAIEELIRLAQAGETLAILNLLDQYIPGGTVRLTPPLELTAID